MLISAKGRGGVGNIRETPDAYKGSEEDLRVPTLKSAVYTTGRGGTGNMAINDPSHPENARIAQDVEAVPPAVASDFHGGRGVRSSIRPLPPSLPLLFFGVSPAAAAVVVVRLGGTAMDGKMC